MKIVISPAKSLDFESRLPTTRATQPVFLQTAEKLNKKMVRMSKSDISVLMNISAKLADLNYSRFHNFKAAHTKENSRPAIYAFNGDVYNGLDAYSLPIEKLDSLQEKLRILSGLYGILRPLDLIQPYRLEMGTKIGIEKKSDLYGVWREKITGSLNHELQDKELLINLASNEYFKAVNRKEIMGSIVSPVFKDYKNGKLKIISFYAKKARGSMVRYIIDSDAKSVEDLKNFDYDNYRYSAEETKKEDEPVFIR